MIKLEITYNNGNKLSNIVEYAHVEDSVLWFAVHHKVKPVFVAPVKVPIENIKSFDITEVSE